MKPKRTLEAIWGYWLKPPSVDLPLTYLPRTINSQFLLGVVKRHIPQEAKILEIGCSVGRNLNFLFRAGFRNLAGVEINEKATQLLKESYPSMASITPIFTSPIEDVIRTFKDNEFDAVFTMTVLMHIHPDSEWIFGEMVRITKDFILTFENERENGRLLFPRNYRKVFEALGVRQVEEIDGGDILPPHPEFHDRCSIRVFRK